MSCDGPSLRSAIAQHHANAILRLENRGTLFLHLGLRIALVRYLQAYKKNEMNIKSFNENIEYSDNRIVTKVILETSFSKEIRILLKNGQTMKEHKAPYPIIVHILEGKIDFGIGDEIKLLQAGDIITLESNVYHDLTAKKDSIVRLTLSKLDDVSRVKKVADNS